MPEPGNPQVKQIEEEERTVLTAGEAGSTASQGALPEHTIVVEKTASYELTSDDPSSLRAREEEATLLARIKPGQVLSGIFEIIAPLGRGGMSVVYKAKHLLMNRTVALKILLPGKELDTRALHRFQQEALAAAKLDHPSIVKVYDFGFDHELELPYMVMDYVEGETLAASLAASVTIDEEHCKTLIGKLAKALTHAHERNVIHRDIKPSNVVLNRDSENKEQVNILDFGIAKITDPDAGQLTITQTGEIFGSPNYMSPEQCLGQKLDARSDIYSLGCVFFECLVGSPPFKSESPIETMMLHLSQRTVDFKGKQVSGATQNIILKCLEKEPAKRFQSMQELSEALLGKMRVKASFATRIDHYLRQAKNSNRRLILSVVAFLLIFIGTETIMDYVNDPRIGPDEGNNPEAWVDLSLKLKQKGKLDKALEALEQARKLAPNNNNVIVQLSNSYRSNQVHDYDKAAQLLEELLKQNPTDSSARTNLIYVAQKIANNKMDQGLPVAAREWAQKAVDLSFGKEASACYNLARIEDKLGHIESAQNYFEKAMNLEPLKKLYATEFYKFLKRNGQTSRINTLFPLGSPEFLK